MARVISVSRGRMISGVWHHASWVKAPEKPTSEDIAQEIGNVLRLKVDEMFMSGGQK